MLCIFYQEIQTVSITVARVAKLVDAPDLGSGVLRRVGSSPITRTIGQKRNFRENFPLFYFYDLR